jgi:hypothetical protein
MNAINEIELKLPQALFNIRFGVIGAEVLTLSIGIQINICAKLNICSLNAPPSPSRKPLAVIQ